MKKSIICTSAAALLASNSIAAFASSVTIPNSFTAGTPAVAAQVNANFNALAVGVNDNDSRVTTNASAITALDGRVSANETAIAGLQGGGSCPSDMVAVGSLCVDKYEASLWDAATGGTQLSAAGGAPYYPCAANGSDCAGAIYARSVAGVNPANRVTWHQAVQACASVGKRLPTTTEWQMAATGTPEGTGDGVNGCNSNAGNSIVATGSAPTCVSTAGAFDMVGNVWEWVADISPVGAATGWSSLDTSGAFGGLTFGEAYDNDSGATPTPRSVVIMDNRGGALTTGGLLNTNSRSGFRCVR